MSARVWINGRRYVRPDGSWFVFLAIDFDLDRYFIADPDGLQRWVDHSSVRDAELVQVAPSGILLDFDMPIGDDLGGES